MGVSPRRVAEVFLGRHTLSCAIHEAKVASLDLLIADPNKGVTTNRERDDWARRVCGSEKVGSRSCGAAEDDD